MSVIKNRYLSKQYITNNPGWHSKDGVWKGQHITKLLKQNMINPNSIVDIGCGTGSILAFLREVYPIAQLYGYDIAPDVEIFWQHYKEHNINFYLGDFIANNRSKYDVLLMIDIVEHLENPWYFLREIQKSAIYFVFHFPLDLSAINILREKTIISAREKLGHIYYYTKELAFSLLKECDYEIITHSFSGLTFYLAKNNLKTCLVSIPRWIVYTLNKDWGVRLLGGESLFILARTKLRNHS